jgi:hypothetical protein
MDQNTITLIAALVAAVTSTANVGFTYLSSSILEREKWENAREDEKRKNLRSAIEAFAQELAAGVWHANWLLWVAAHTPSDFSNKNLEDYNKEIAKVLPKLLTTRVLVAAHDVKIYEQLSQIANRFYRLDVNIANTGHIYRTSNNDGLEQMSKLYSGALAFHEYLGHELAQILSSEKARASR